MRLSDSERGLALQKLMKKKLGRLFDWSVPVVHPTVGPFDVTVFERFEEARMSLRDELHSHVSPMPLDEIDRLVDPETADEDPIKINWRNLKTDRIRYLHDRIPPWFAGGFGHEDYKADFEYWAQMPSLTNHEALLLSLGVEPKHFLEEDVVNLQAQADKGDELWPSLTYLIRRRAQIERQFPSYGRGDKISPRNFFAWARQVQLEMHPDFYSHFLPTKTSSDSVSKDSDDNDLDPRTRSSMLKLIAVMAVCGYSYKPGQKYGKTVSEILDDASKLGINITDDTVRNYLKLSEKMISADWKADNSYSDSD